MDFAEGRDPVVGGSLAKAGAGKLLGLLFGCLIVGVMIFMMFVILGGLMNGEP